jgi:hypothetical protein
MPGRILIEEGSILLLAPIHSVAEAVIYYVGIRQALELLLRDFRAAVNRWLRRAAHAPLRVIHSTMILKPPLANAEIAWSHPREHAPPRSTVDVPNC